jgi:hypothetical protein
MISKDLIAAHMKNSVFGMWCHCIVVDIYTFWNLARFFHSGYHHIQGENIIQYFVLLKYIPCHIFCVILWHVMTVPCVKFGWWNEADVTWWDMTCFIGVADVSSLLGCSTVSLGEWCPTFWRFIVLSKHQELLPQRHSVTVQKTGIFKYETCHRLMNVTVKYSV